MAATEFVPDQAKTEGITAHVIWMTTGPQLRRRLRRDDLRGQPEPRGHRHPGDPGDAESRRPQPGPRLRGRGRVHAGLVRRRGGQARPVRARRRGLDPERGDQRRGPLGGDGRRPRHRPADHHQRVGRPPRAQGRGRGRARHLRHLRRHPGDEEQPDRGDGPPRLPRLEAGSRAPACPVVCIPGCPAQPDNTTETLLYLALHLAGRAPAPELDEALRPKWLFGRTVREGCNRAGFTEQGQFATEYGSDHRCLVKLGCKGPVVKCNVPVRGWQSGVGGCPNVGGICMACTMPGFPDKYMPFMDEDRWGAAAATIIKFTYGPIVRYMRQPAHPHEVRQGAGVAQAGPRSAAATRSGGSARRDAGLLKAERRGRAMATVDSTREQEGRRQGDVVGSDHPDRRQPRHPHGDRLRQPEGQQVLLDLDGVPRLRHLHEGDRSA